MFWLGFTAGVVAAMLCFLGVVAALGYALERIDEMPGGKNDKTLSSEPTPGGSDG